MASKENRGRPRHTCYAEGCMRQIPMFMLMCGMHWRKVPQHTQALVLATWNERLKYQSSDDLHKAIEARKAHVAACDLARAAVAEWRPK